MEAIRIKVEEACGLPPSPNRELKPQPPLKRKGIDKVCHQNSDSKKRRRSSRSSIEFKSDDDNVPPPSKRHKLPSEAPPHLQRNIPLSTSHQLAQPPCQIRFPPPAKRPVRLSGRPKEPKLLWPKWRPSSMRRRSNAQKYVNSATKKITLKESKEKPISKPKPISKSKSPTRGSFTAKSTKDESPKSSPLPTFKSKIKRPISAQPESSSHTKSLQPSIVHRDTSETPALPNTTNAAPPSQVDQKPTSANIVPNIVDAASNKSSQPKRPRPSDQEPDDNRPHKNRKSAYFSQDEIDATAELLINILMVCSGNSNPGRATLHQLHDLLKDLPTPLNKLEDVHDSEDFIAFRAAVNRHELAGNWGYHLDGFADLKCKVGGKLLVGMRVAAVPKSDRFGNFVV